MTTPVYITGGEGLDTLTTNGGGICNAINGSPTIQSTIKHSGDRSFRFNPSSATCYFQKDLGTPTLVVARFYLRVDTAPSGDCEFLMFRTAAGANVSLLYDYSEAKLGIYNGSTWTYYGTITLQQFYLVDIRVNVSANPNVIDWKIDGVAQTQVSISQAATTVAGIRPGTSTAISGDWYIDDIVVSFTSGDYPIGAGGTERLAPGSDGTHNAGTDIMEDNAGTDIGATTAYDKINSVPPDATTYVRQAANGTGNYAEISLGNITATHSGIIGAMAYLAYTSATTTGNKGCTEISKDAWSSNTVLWGDIGGTTADMSDGSTTNLYYKSVIVASVTDDTTVNALQARMGGSDDANPDPYWIDLWVEVAYTTGALLVIQDSTHAHLADNLTLTQHNIFAIQDSTHAHLADNLTLTQHNILSVQDAAHVHVADNLTIIAHDAITLVIQDSQHVLVSENLILTQHNILSVQDAVHLHLIDNLTLTQHNVLTVQDAAHLHLADSLILTVGGTLLAIQDAAHLHAADNLILSVGGTFLVIQNALHNHLADNLTLTQHNILSVQDALHSLYSSILILRLKKKPVPTGIDKYWKEEQIEMKRSQFLTKQLLEAQKINEEIRGTNIALMEQLTSVSGQIQQVRDSAKNALDTNARLLENLARPVSVPSSLQQKIVPPAPVTESEFRLRRNRLQNLQKANTAKLEKRKAEEDKRLRQIENLKKARRSKKRKQK